MQHYVAMIAEILSRKYFAREARDGLSISYRNDDI